MGIGDSPRRQTFWRSTRRTLQLASVWLLVGLSFSAWSLVIWVVISAVYSLPWTGFNEHIGPQLKPDQPYQPAKALWDWLQLLVIPVALAVGALLFSRSERIAEREIALDREQEALLQAYLDHMTDLLLEKHLRTAEGDSEVLAIAKARTITVLRRLDQTRRASLLTFLREAGLLNMADTAGLLVKADLSEANITKANLRGANLLKGNLHKANLSGAMLADANLREAHLQEADLNRACLRSADLFGANLCEANLQMVNMTAANLKHAEMTQAKLSGSNMAKADLQMAILIETNLRGAYLNMADLSSASMNKADLNGAHLFGAVLSGADLSGADLSGADLDKAQYDAGTRWPQGFTPPPEAIKVEEKTS